MFPHQVAQNRQSVGLEHRSKFARRPRKQKQVRNRSSRRNVEAWRSSKIIRQNGRAFRDVGLPGDPIRQSEAPLLESSFDLPKDRFVILQGSIGQIRHQFTRQIVGRGAQAASDKNEFAARRSFEDRVFNCCSVRDRGLALNP